LGIIAEGMVVLTAKLLRVAYIQFLGIVQFLLTETGRVDAQTPSRPTDVPIHLKAS
jgi:hypothetical protein